MCGIFGFNFEDKKLVSSMKKALRHRGPNHSSQYIDKNISLGYTRLSIIDLKGGDQPIFNEDKSVILFFNGEIYSFKEIREILEQKGHRFQTKSDTECIVHAYEEYGYDSLKLFNGMFSFVIYDINNKSLFIARDRLGIKPLYYSYDGKFFLFASEIKALLKHDMIKREIDNDVLNNYFTLRYCSGEKTIFKGIRKLLPGHFLIYKNKKIKIKKYWDLNFCITNKSLNYYAQNFRKLLYNSVKYRMISDVPIGALLSGGIDSSSIVAMMRRNSDEKIRTYTLGFDTGISNEFDTAKLIAQKFDTDHKEYVIDSGYVKYLPKIVRQLDEPVADPTSIPNYILSKMTSNEIKVLINGDGADEVFGGYEQYRYMKLLKIYSDVPNIIRKAYLGSFRFVPKEPFFLKLSEFTENPNDFENSYTSLISVFGEKEKKVLYSNHFKKIIATNHSYNREIIKSFTDFLNRMLYHDIKTYLPDNMLMKYDRLTMAHSIEGRVPFCDHKLVEFSTRLPSKFKLKGFNEKFLIRYSMKKILPKQIIKKKKQRFMVPTDSWYTKDFGEMSRNIIDENSKLVSKYFNPKYIENLFNVEKMMSTRLLNFNKLTSLYYSRQLWSITNFILWYNEFISDRN